jgi:hypothetical protein
MNNANPNKEILQQIIDGIGLSNEEVKRRFPDLDKEEEYVSESIKTLIDEKKIRAYEELEVNSLPLD